jgi:hypothetical protein
MTHRSIRELERRLDDYDPGADEPDGERPPELTVEEKRVLDEHFGSSEDLDRFAL